MHIIILKKENDFFPHPRAYNANSSSNVWPPVWTEEHMAPVRWHNWKTKRMRARCAPVGWNTRAPVSKVREEKSGLISLQSLVNWLVSRSAEAGLWTCKLTKSKGKQIKPKWGRNGYLLPNTVANLFAPNSSLGEQIKSAYMPSWDLLGMTTVR